MATGRPGLLALGELGDLPRMIDCALDAARHDRMLSLTGGDAAALAEASATLERIAAQDDPDLARAPDQYRRLTRAHAAATGVTRQGAPAPV
jgi:hypothetical protein